MLLRNITKFTKQYSKGISLDKSKNLLSSSMMANSYISEGMDTTANTTFSSIEDVLDDHDFDEYFLVCSTYNCNTFIPIVCNMCKIKLEIVQWHIEDQVCKCGTNNIYYYIDGAEASYKCRKCNSPIDKSKSNSTVYLLDYYNRSA